MITAAAYCSNAANGYSDAFTRARRQPGSAQLELPAATAAATTVGRFVESKSWYMIALTQSRLLLMASNTDHLAQNFVDSTWLSQVIIAFKRS